MNEQYPEYIREEESIDIKKYIFLILSHWWWFGIAIFISLTIAYLVNRYSEEVYEVSASVIVEDKESQMGSVETMLNELTRVRNRRRKATVENEISILKSYSMARRALEELVHFDITYTAVGRREIAESRMYKSSPFIVVPDTSRTNATAYPIDITILSRDEYLLEIDDNYDIRQVYRFGDPVEYDNFNFTIYLKNPGQFTEKYDTPRKYYFTFNNINTLANSYRQALNVEVNSDKGSILTLSIQGPVSEQIADYLNKLCDVYIRSNLEEKNAVSENTIRFIDGQLSEIIDSLQSAELRLQNFRASNKVIDISREGNYMFEQLEELQSEKAVLDINANYYEYLENYVQEKTDNSDVIAPSVIGIQDPLLNSLVAELNQLNLKKRGISFTIRENNPEYLRLRAQIESLRNNLLENLRNVIQSNNMSRANLETRIARVERQLQKLPFTERQLINFQREFDINDQIYTFLLEKRAEAGITRASNTADNKVLDTALPENAKMIKPKVSMNYMLALVIGAGLPFLLIILIEFFNTKIQSRKDIESATNVPVLGSIGHNSEQTDLPVIEKPKSSLAESFRGLRANLKFLLKDTGKQVIAISSTVSGEGKTFCATNLAAIIAMAGKKTVLVGLDLRQPKIHRLFNLENDTGLSTYLIGRSTAEEIIHPTGIENLTVVNSGPIPPNPGELIGSEKLAELLGQLRKKFDYIVLDTPPMAIVSDAMLLKELADIYLFVVRQNFSNKNVIQLLDDLYNKKDMKNMYILVNDVQVKGYYGYNYYGYDYGYGYEYYGKGYYSDEDSQKENILKRVTSRLFKK